MQDEPRPHHRGTREEEVEVTEDEDSDQEIARSERTEDRGVRECSNVWTTTCHSNTVWEMWRYQTLIGKIRAMTSPLLKQTGKDKDNRFLNHSDKR